MPATKQEPRYDLFISYRRGAAYELAMLLQNQLHQRGLAAFLDRDLRRGVFDETLLRNIEKSTSFLVILTANALDRCSDQDDWLRREIVHAMTSKRNIIPLQVDGFQFTAELVKNLDPVMRELSRYQAVEYSRTYFENTIERIVTSVEEDKVEREANVAEETRLAIERTENQIQQQREPAPEKFAVEQIEAQTMEYGEHKSKQFREKEISAGTVKINPKDGEKYVWIPVGTFSMGCSPSDRECAENEKPAHLVTITKGFWLGQTPVAQAAYQYVIGVNPSHFRGERLPVESVSWSEARAYCKAVGGRLPTEAEWEYAGRAGDVEARHGDLNAISWYSGNSDGKTHEVGQKKPNTWGLYDMLGNVWELVADWYDVKYYYASPLEDPIGPALAQHRVVRGGSWGSPSNYIRVSNRDWLSPASKGGGFGFRCALDVL